MIDADYLAMQRNFYNDPSIPVEAIVGHYSYHENFPYETLLLFRYGDLRRPLFRDMEKRRAFDIGCGEGRMVRRMSQLFQEVDGADVSEKMLAAARVRCPQATFFLSSGKDCGAAPSNHYDFVYCTISLQHICSYSIRRSILADIRRILRPGGFVTLQLLAARDYPFLPSTPVTAVSEDVAVRLYRRDHQHAGYFADNFEATSTNSGSDGLISFAEVPDVLRDFGEVFCEQDVWFWDISVCRPTLPKIHPNAHLDDGYWGTHFVFLHGQKAS